jgi:hypothetical protein
LTTELTFRARSSSRDATDQHLVHLAEVHKKLVAGFDFVLLIH